MTKARNVYLRTNQATRQVSKVATAHRAIFLYLVLVAFLAVGCDRDWAPRLVFGVPVPNMRFDITPVEDIDPQRLYPIFQRIAQEEDFLNYRSESLAEQVEQQSRRSRPVWSFEWNDSSGGKPIYRLAFSRNAHNANNYDAFTVILGNTGTESFDVDDWLFYKRWSEQVLPAAFPNASIRESRHPASFTATEDLRAIAEQAGMRIPEKYLESVGEHNSP